MKSQRDLFVFASNNNSSCCSSDLTWKLALLQRRNEIHKQSCFGHFSRLFYEETKWNEHQLLCANPDSWRKQQLKELKPLIWENSRFQRKTFAARWMTRINFCPHPPGSRPDRDVIQINGQCRARLNSWCHYLVFATSYASGPDRLALGGHCNSVRILGVMFPPFVSVGKLHNTNVVLHLVSFLY